MISSPAAKYILVSTAVLRVAAYEPLLAWNVRSAEPISRDAFHAGARTC